ncbi:MAG: hypothetical protein GY780_00230 [bacterium]|nr:hypothetical protein [bacterium]
MLRFPNHLFHKILITILALAVTGLVGWVIFNAFDFYTTPLNERPHHPDYRQFRPAGPIGHSLGIAGSSMMLLLFVYSLRKRMKFMRHWGDLRIWLRYHIFLGIAGPVLVVLHSSFTIKGLVAVSFWSMTAVALSGVFGRYLYQQIPRNLLGEDLSVMEIEDRQEAILVELSEKFQLDTEGIEKLEKIALSPLENRQALIALLILPVANMTLARQLHTFSVGLGSGDQIKAKNLAKFWVLNARRTHLFHLIRDLFHYWHVFHKPFAVIMILVMLIHVAVALALGYTGK